MSWEELHLRSLLLLLLFPLLRLKRKDTGLLLDPHAPCTPRAHVPLTHAPGALPCSPSLSSVSIQPVPARSARSPCRASATCQGPPVPTRHPLAQHHLVLGSLMVIPRKGVKRTFSFSFWNLDFAPPRENPLSPIGAISPAPTNLVSPRRGTRATPSTTVSTPSPWLKGDGRAGGWRRNHSHAQSTARVVPFSR